MIVYTIDELFEFVDRLLNHSCFRVNGDAVMYKSPDGKFSHGVNVGLSMDHGFVIAPVNAEAVLAEERKVEEQEKLRESPEYKADLKLHEAEMERLRDTVS